MELENVMSKIKKLQKLYEGAKAIKSEGEAANAAAAIQRLLAEYNISMSEIQASTEEDKHKDDIKEQIESGYTFKSIGGIWEYKLANVLCKFNFCKCFMMNNSYKRIMILGKEENLTMVKWLRETLSKSFVEISSERWKEYKETDEYKYSFPHISKDRFRRGFLAGCADGLNSKLQEISDNEKKNDTVFGTKVTALALRNENEISDYLESKDVKLKTVNLRSAGTSSARRMGYETGRETDINKPISSNQHKNANNIKLL